MSIETILRSQPLPVTVPQLETLSGLQMEVVYTELVRLEGEGKAKPILGYAGHRKAFVSGSNAGWIYLN